MAVLKSIATGNFTSSSTWGLVDSTSYSNSETATTALTTSMVASSNFTPGAITVEGIAVKLSVRTGTTGTMSVELSTGGSQVAGTSVTINTADLPVAATADLNGGWIYFKFSSPVLLVAATAYAVRASTSSASQVSLFSTATSNWSRALVTTTTQAPAAGDDLIIAGEYISAGSSNTLTVTMNETATTDYGAASTSTVTPGLAICSKGVLTWGTTAATNYNLKLSGHAIIYSGGTMNMGTTGTPCPRDSTQKFLFDCGANVDFGLTVRNLGTLSMQGLSRSSGKNIVTCKLNTDEAINSTSLGVDTDTGWLDNDQIVVASTTQTVTQSEIGALNGNAGASSLTVDGFAGAGGGLAAAHSGSSPTQAEVILLTRNVSLFGASTTLQAYIDIRPTASVDIDWAEFYYLGSATTLKRGIDVTTTTGSFTMHFSSLHDFVVTSSRGLNMTGTSGNGFTMENCVTWNINDVHVNVAATTNTTWMLKNSVFIRNVAAANMINLSDLGGTVDGVTVVSGAGQYSINFAEATLATGTFQNITSHSNTFSPILTNTSGVTITNLVSWRNGSFGLSFTGNSKNLMITTFEAFGNGTANILIPAGSDVTADITGFVSSGDSSFATASGISISGALAGFRGRIFSSTFGVASGIKVAHTTADINCFANSEYDLDLRNCLLSSTTEVGSQTSMIAGSNITSQKHDQTAGNHRTFFREGTVSIETTSGLFDVTPSARMTPTSATEKLSCTMFRSAVANGQSLTVTVKVRESVVGDGTDYNGSRVRLIVKRNAAAGITSDTVLATATVASEGAFETLSGTTATVTDDAVLEFAVDCDGTTGWVNVDTFTVASQTNTKGLNYWFSGQPFGYGDNSSGGGSAATVGYACMG